MLSPVREGSGLYCHTLGRAERDVGLCLLREKGQISLQPRINVGSKFQAEIPELQDRSQWEEEEEASVLVWKPWGDIATNVTTQDRVQDLLSTARSSAVPAGNASVELALHCLHQAQGHILEALDMLLSGGGLRLESHPLADYHYTGADTWTPLEQELFGKAFSLHRKDFHLIQKEVQTKTVPQCVEHYYLWKKRLQLDPGRAGGRGKRVKRSKAEGEEAGEKAVCRKRHHSLPKENPRMKPRSSQGLGSSSRGPNKLLFPSGSGNDPALFPCRECGRAFGTIQGRNAHMKLHRPREQPRPLLRVEWPLEKLEKEVGESQLLLCSKGSRETGR